MIHDPAIDELYRAREMLAVFRRHAADLGVPDQVVAEAMLVDALMLMTGGSEDVARAALASLVAKKTNRDRADFDYDGDQSRNMSRRAANA